MQPYCPQGGPTNLDILELEYTNSNPISVSELHTLLQRWGAFGGLAVSHGPEQSRHVKWLVITCITSAVVNPRTDEMQYVFRLLFECEETVNKVFQASLARDYDTFNTGEQLR